MELILKFSWGWNFDRNAWGSCFWPTFCLGSLGKAILATILLGDLLGADLVGSVTQGCSYHTFLPYFCDVFRFDGKA